MLEGVLSLAGVHDTWDEKNFQEFVSLYRDPHSVIESELGRSVRHSHKQWRYACNEFVSVFTKNSRGFFHPPPPLAKPENVVRVIGIGDSYTQGVGIRKGEKHYPGHLESIMNRSLPEGSSKVVECINLGISDFDPVHELEILEKYGLDYKPDFVIMLINDSDLINLRTRGGLNRRDPRRRQRIDAVRSRLRRREILYRYSRIFRIVSHGLFGYDRTLIDPHRKSPLLDHQVEVELVEIARWFIETGKENSFVPVVFVLNLFESSEYPLKSLYHSLKEADCIALYWPLFREKHKNALFWKQDFHLNTRGYERVAEKIYRAIRSHPSARHLFTPSSGENDRASREPADRI